MIRKKTFYVIKDNLVRFYYGVILLQVYYLNRYGQDYVWARIEESVKDFISLRFEDIVKEFIILSMRHNPDINALDVGTYYADSKYRNIEYDIVIKEKVGYFIISCKYLSTPLDKALEEEEIKKMESAEGIISSGFGFASIEGYEKTGDEILRLTGEDIYSKHEIESAEKLRVALQ